MKGITVLKGKKIPDCYWSTYGKYVQTLSAEFTMFTPVF